MSGLIHCGCSRSAGPGLAELQGTWVGLEMNGPRGECRISIQGNRVRFQGAHTNEWYAGTLTLNESMIPKQAVIQIEECGFPQYVNKSARAIYKLETKTLTLAGNEPGTEAAPTDFLPSDRTRVFVFTRQ